MNKEELMQEALKDDRVNQKQFVAYPNAKVYVVPYEEFQKMDLNDTETKHTCGQWVDLWPFPYISMFNIFCKKLHYGYEDIAPRIIATDSMPPFFVRNFIIMPEFFQINSNLSQWYGISYEAWIDIQKKYFKEREDKVRYDIDAFWDNHLGSYDDVEDFVDSVVEHPSQYDLDVNVYGMTKEELLSSEEFMNSFIYGGEYNDFFKKPNW